MTTISSIEKFFLRRLIINSFNGAFVTPPSGFPTGFRPEKGSLKKKSSLGFLARYLVKSLVKE